MSTKKDNKPFLLMQHNSKLGNVDDLVKSISLHVLLSTYLSGRIAPFVLLYLTWTYFAVFVYDIFTNDSDTIILAMLAVILIAVFHIFINLCCFWSVHVNTFLNARKIQRPEDATFVKVCPTKNNGSPELVRLRKTEIKNNKIIANDLPGITFDIYDESTIIYWFVFQKTKYIYNPERRQFSALEFPIHKNYKYYGEAKGYKSEEEVDSTKSLYGDNSMIMVVPEFMELFTERATAPFFVFQIFAVLLWCLDDYWYYSLFTLFMLIVFECTLVQQQLRNMAEIRKMGNKPYQINCFRYNRWRSILSNELVPGDVISIGRSQNNQLVPCDIVLLRGSCIVDESMLTGESVPQLKEPIVNVDDRERQLDVDGDSKLHCLFGGTKVVQHTAPDKNGIRAPDDGCIAYVLRNGFNTSQGKLLRTILFGVKRVTENNLETFAFIVFLLIFAVAAAAYVWIKGCLDPERNRYKLALECTLILTSIIPPDLPIELTLAVNTSLLKLTKLYVYCTEPFRIPMAGKLQICCFDKTGTLTSDDLMVEGVAGLTDDHLRITSIDDIPENTIQVLASCHTLVQLDDTLVGDPLEKATLKAIEWKLTRQDGVIPKRGKLKPLKIYHRFYFSSALKRMSVIAGYLTPFTNEVHYMATVKGAPEILMGMLKDVPSWYEKTYIEFSRRGARVLALAIKDLGTCDTQTIRELKREQIECDLIFVGFVIISCPLKPDSKAVIKEIMRASHKVVMITGDNPLTACYVASELRITRKPIVVLQIEVNRNSIGYDKSNNDTDDDDGKTQSKWLWKTIANDITVEIDGNHKALIKEYDLAITGDGLTYLYEHKLDYFLNIIPYISVYARVAPKQKEFVITTLKSLGYFTLMCGDGTNDVGALKHAHVGVSILSKQPRIKKRPAGAGAQLSGDSTGSLRRPLTSSDAYRSLQPNRRDRQSSSADSKSNVSLLGDRNRNAGGVAAASAVAAGDSVTAGGTTATGAGTNPAMSVAQLRLQQAMKEMEEEQMQIVKLGDASIAAPFTSKSASITSVCHIIKQGRCTLVTTLQMFKILALNAIISAYCQSVLYIDGVKFSDSQATLQGIFIAACFLFITRSKPLTVLSKEAPLHNVFNIYTCSSILLQLCVHFTGLVYLTQGAELLSPPREGKVKLNVDLTAEEKEEFVPNIVNSTIYIMCMALQISTFIVNHKGHPFMENLMENKYLLCAITMASVVVASLSIGFPVDLLDTFQIIQFPIEFKKTLIFVLVADLILAFAVDRICSYLFVSSRKKNELL